MKENLNNEINSNSAYVSIILAIKLLDKSEYFDLGQLTFTVRKKIRTVKVNGNIFQTVKVN